VQKADDEIGLAETSKSLCARADLTDGGQLLLRFMAIRGRILE
jgi:hypothetical protein